MSPSLIGPPEIRNSNTQPPPQQQQQPPSLGLTENSSATYLETGNPCLDLFFHVVPDTPSTTLLERLSLAWSYNPLTTLKLICNLRGVRGTGKSDKRGFYTAAIWLHKNHPKTLACNLAAFAEFGYFKDFPEILFRIVGGIHPSKSVENNENKVVRKVSNKRKSTKTVDVKVSKKRKGEAEKSADVRIREDALRQEKEKEAASAARHEKHAELAKKALEFYNHDPEYRFLHDRVSDLFANQLKLDIELLNSGNANKISLAGKWCPSLDSCFDRATLLCEAIARKVFPREEYEGVEEAHYVYRVRDRLRKEVLVPLRKALELPEVFMAARKWGEVNYNRVASVAMKTYKDLFKNHDEDRFEEYLENVKSGKAKIAAGALLPHEIIDGGDVAELQWARMVEDMKKEGALNNCIAVCDVSGSMKGTPMEVCVALGLLLSDISDEPWKGKVITFSKKPQLHLIEGNDLESKTTFIRRMDWGSNTNFQKVFDLILNVAVKANLKAEDMIKRVFVFSDMEFDQASRNPWETDYMVIKRKFEENGYGDAVPEIVFWNLRDSKATPVSKNQKGCALVSGFSKNAMKLFLEGKVDALEPESVMEAAIDREEYKKLVVLD